MIDNREPQPNPTDTRPDITSNNPPIEEGMLASRDELNTGLNDEEMAQVEGLEAYMEQSDLAQSEGSLLNRFRKRVHDAIRRRD